MKAWRSIFFERCIESDVTYCRHERQARGCISWKSREWWRRGHGGGHETLIIALDRRRCDSHGAPSRFRMRASGPLSASKLAHVGRKGGSWVDLLPS